MTISVQQFGRNARARSFDTHPMRTPEPWCWWWITMHRGALELDDRVTPRGLAIELEIEIDGDRLIARWLLSETGEQLQRAHVGRA